jgi:hypothetical protein
MYNMNISVFGMTFRLEILILIVILYWVLWGHVLCSCSNGNLMESLTNMMHTQNDKMNKSIFKYTTTPGVSGGVPYREGFTGANTNNGESSTFNNNSLNTSSWFTPNLTFSKGVKPDKGVQNILNRPKQQIPLPEGQMLMFANTPFKPECCPNAYSTSTGCACMTTTQYNYLIDRGGNNVPYSEY